MNLLISVKTKWAKQIAEGEKTWELRKSFCNPVRNPIGSVIIYATAPASSIVAIANYATVRNALVQNIWELNQEKGNLARVTEEEFNSYYQGKDFGTILMLGQVRKLQIPLAEIKAVKPDFRPPQHYQYLPNDLPLMQLIREKSLAPLGSNRARSH